MNSKIIRQKFKDFFEEKHHLVVPSAPMVIKDDPTLMFTNAGMNQFKDIFLGTRVPEAKRIANSQKCLRVSGKHNDLEEVGLDTYHHTMFEMLGNWSFGDYFKREAIDWAWEFLTDKMKINPDRLYVTIFEGDAREGIERDTEAYNHWLRHLDPSRILEGSKKDNFWEMGDTGPCGPCSEIHADIRSDEGRAAVPGSELVNTGNPQVIEIWNLVFIQFDRRSDGTLIQLPQKHVDTGMGFERLAMVVQGKKSNYDTDIFQSLIAQIGTLTGTSYGADPASDVAMRVIADHVRAVAFAIADGQLPSNTGAGYVIRRILRRAVRYGYTFLHCKKPFMAALVPVLGTEMGKAFPELSNQNQLISKVIAEEEGAFLRTLEAGIQRLDELISAHKDTGLPLSGKSAFELYDTFGFPFDLTQLILAEKGLSVDIGGFKEEMNRQKNRSKKAAEQQASDWIILVENREPEFIGYDQTVAQVRIIRYRQIKTQKSSLYQLAFDKTPFYAESGGQVGDTGTLEYPGGVIPVLDTRKENDLAVHLTESLPPDPGIVFTARVDESRRLDTMRNHSATHLLHSALRTVLGSHVEQKGSLVTPEYLRFDFSHFQKLSEKEIESVEVLVNRMIREDQPLDEKRNIPIGEARKLGAMALFGEKYGDRVRVIRFGQSTELCGGTHIVSTGRIGLFRITSESSIAAGIRRIEAQTGVRAESEARNQSRTLHELAGMLKSGNSITESVHELIEENQQLRKKMDELGKESLKKIKSDLKSRAEHHQGITLICEKTTLSDTGLLKDLAYQLKNEIASLYLVLGSLQENTPGLIIMISDELVKSLGLNAGTIIRESAREIQGGGGGQPFFATAGGKNPEGLDRALAKARQALLDKLS